MLGLILLKRKFLIFFAAVVFFQSGFAAAAVLHFYDNPSVPQPLFHVTLEYKGNMYDADTRGSGSYPISSAKKISKHQIYIDDSWVDEVALNDQLGRQFDFNFVWDSEKTYCSKLVGKALGISPKPMNFAGTHYIKYKPDWLTRTDPGLSPDDIYEFGLKNGQLLTLPKAGTPSSSPSF